MPFNKDVADVYKEIKKDFQDKKTYTTPTGNSGVPIDGAVKEEINADLDKRIKEYEKK